MATNEQQRRAIGANNEATRRSFADDLNRLVNPSGTNKTLKAIEPRGARAAKRGASTYTAPATGTGGGIASPLTEKLTPSGGSTRTYYEETSNLYSSDYLLAVEIEPLRSVTMIDANGDEVTLNFAPPPSLGG